MYQGGAYRAAPNLCHIAVGHQWGCSHVLQGSRMT